MSTPINAIAVFQQQDCAHIDPRDIFHQGDWDFPFLREDWVEMRGSKGIAAFVAAHPNCLPAVTARGFRFLVPEYLRAALLDPGGEVALFLRQHMQGARPDERWLSVLRELSLAEAEAILQVLRWLATNSHDGIDREEAVDSLERWMVLMRHVSS